MIQSSLYSFIGLIIFNMVNFNLLSIAGYTQLVKPIINLEKKIPLGINIKQFSLILYKLNPSNPINFKKYGLHPTYYYFLNQKLYTKNIYHINENFKLVQYDNYPMNFTNGHVTLNKAYNIILGANRHLNHKNISEQSKEKQNSIKSNNLFQSKYIYTYYEFPIHMIHKLIHKVKLNFFKNKLFRITYATIPISKIYLEHYIKVFNSYYQLIQSNEETYKYQSKPNQYLSLHITQQSTKQYLLDLIYENKTDSRQYHEYINQVIDQLHPLTDIKHS